MNHRDRSGCRDVTIGRPIVEGEDTCQDAESNEHEGEPEAREVKPSNAQNVYGISAVFGRKGQLHNAPAVGRAVLG